jgi:transposase InsO family protein
VSRGAIFAFIAAEQTSYGVRRLCRVLQVSKTAFYDWVRRDGGPTERELADAYAANEIFDAWAEHRRVYGARRMTAEVHDRGRDWTRKHVARLMRVGGIEGVHRRRKGKRRKNVPGPAPAPDLVGRQFTVDEPDRLWVADITYLRSWEGFLYLAVVMDACTRRVVGWAMTTHLRKELVLDAVGMAIFTRRPAAGLVHHSDRGSQYTSYEFGKTLRTSGVLASMGAVGTAYDNAMCESFFATLKEELVYQRAWPTRHELEMEVFSYIEGFYNPMRRHSRLDNLSPANYETMLMTRNEVSA